MKFSPWLEEYRFLDGNYGSQRNDTWGAFLMPGPCGANLKVIAADGTDPIVEFWEHVSVSTERRIPNWIEMCFVKDLFWAAEECVVQFHPPKSEYVNNHPKVLHLWRWAKGGFPTPPSILVGFKELGILFR